MSPVLRSSLRPGRLLVVAIALLVPIVSMARLEAYARQANESDALTALALLSDALEERDVPPESLEELMQVPSIRHRLSDARRAAAGVWSYHGYLLRMERATSGAPALVAWPRSFGRSGRAAYAARSGDGLYQHGNRAGAFSGHEAQAVFETPSESGEPLLAGSSDGWQPLQAE